MKQFSLLIALVGVLLLVGLVVVPPVAGAQAPFDVHSEASYTFGQTMTFSLRAKAPEDVTQATLFFTASQLDSTYVVEIDLAPSRAISLAHEVPLGQVQLLPFTTVTYWWRLVVGGEAFDVAPETLDYRDDRFGWQALSGPQATVHWTGEQVEIGQIALDVVARAWPRLAAVIPVAAGDLPEIYIYPGTAELRSAMLLSGRDWVGGSAAPELGVALVTAVNPRTAVLDLGRSIPHELTHLLLYRATGQGYENVPRWFEEGLATLMQATQPPDQEQVVREAIASGEALPLADLCHTFPAGENHSGMAYAQSASVVGYIQSEYGNHALTEMIRAYSDGADCDSGVRRVLDLSLGELEADWRDARRPLSPLETVWQRAGLWIALLGGGFFLMTLLLLPVRRSR